MTFSEMVETTPNLYPPQIDAGLKQTIYDWFQFRNVVDDRKFKVFFQRALNNAYPRYEQYLRIEPGIAQYDWLVENYMERQIVVNATKSDTVNSSMSSTDTSTRTDDTTQTATGTDTRNITNSGRDINNTSEGVSGNSVVAHTGIDTVENSGTDSVKNSGVDTTFNNVQREVEYKNEVTIENEGKEINTKEGSETHKKVFNVPNEYEITTTTKNNQTKETTKSGYPQSVSIGSTGNTTAAKQGPMDAGVLSSTSPSKIEPPTQPEVVSGGDYLPGSDGELAVNFDGHASSITQGLTHTSNYDYSKIDEKTQERWNVGLITDGDTVKVKTPHYTTEETTLSAYGEWDEPHLSLNSPLTETLEYDGRKQTTTEERKKDKQTEEGQTSTSHGLTSDTTHGLKTKTQHGENVSTNATTNTTTDGTTTYGKITNESLQKIDSITNSGTVSNEGATTQEGQTSSTGENASDTREVVSGRYKEPAEILSKVVSFIVGTNAWTFMQAQLEPCFMATYDI